MLLSADVDGDGQVEVQMREVSSGGSNALSSSSLVQHFGVGQATVVDVEVHWPSGRVEQFWGVSVDQELILVEEP